MIFLRDLKIFFFFLNKIKHVFNDFEKKKVFEF
jgi:hypothetical protein